MGHVYTVVIKLDIVKKGSESKKRISRSMGLEKQPTLLSLYEVRRGESLSTSKNQSGGLRGEKRAKGG